MTATNNLPKTTNAGSQSTNINDNTPRRQLQVVPPIPATTPVANPSAPTPIETTPQKSPHPSVRKWVTLGIIAVVLGGVGYMPLSHSVSGEATVESSPEYRQAITMPESATIQKIYVRQGDKVRIGQPVIELHSDDLEKQIAETNRQITQFTTEKEAAQRQLNFVSSNRDRALTKYNNALQRAARAKQEIASNQQPRIWQLQNIKAEKQALISGLQTQLNFLQKRYNRYEKLRQLGGFSEDGMTDLIIKRQEFITQIGQAKYQIAQVDAQIADAQKQKSDELLDLRQPEVEDAAAAVQSANSEIQKAEADINKYSQQVPQLEAMKQKLLERKQKLTIYATKSGVIIDPELDLLENQKLPEGKPILTIADPSHPTAIAELTQEDYHLVKPGMRVIFRPQDAKMSEYKVIVEALPPTVSFDREQQKRTVKVKLKFENEATAAQLMLGTRGNAHIQVEEMRVYQKLQREFLKVIPVHKFF